jgi:catechol 2,3-dioxygenase-like lactoylglutathione lyase family enzyme
MPGSSATFSRLTPILITDDMDATIAFYRDILGFRVTAQIPDENPTWCFLLRDDAAIMFTTPEEHDHEHSHDDDDGHDHEHEHSGADGLWTMYVYSEGVETLWDEFKDDPKVEYPLYDTHYGMREFGMRDRDGNMLSFGKDV